MKDIDLKEIFLNLDPDLGKARHETSTEIWKRPDFGDVDLYKMIDQKVDAESLKKPLPLAPAAVLIAAIPRGNDWDILLTQRAAHLRQHSGQVAFPGGKCDAADENIMTTALREAEEEIGLARKYVEIVGAMDGYETITGFAVTPVVGILKSGFELKADPNEVEEIFHIPLSYILDENNHTTESRIWKGQERHFYVFPHDTYRIWGATAAILVRFSRIIMDFEQ